VKSFAAAWQFLTVFPFPLKFEMGRQDLEDSALYFPVVAAILGGFAVLFDSLFMLFFPPMVASFLLVVTIFLFSGGLHLDGLSDSADGFFSSRPKERILEIMRDSHVGVMGVTAIVMVLFLKWLALYHLPIQLRSGVVFLVPSLGIINSLLMMKLIPYARKDGGLASVFLIRNSWLSMVLGYITFGFLALYVFEILGVIIIFTSILFALLFCVYSNKKIGGFTGDTLGALIEMTEVIVPLSVLCMQRTML